MPCDTCLLGYFASRYGSRWWQSFDPMTSSSLTFAGRQVNVRSNKVKFSATEVWLKVTGVESLATDFVNLCASTVDIEYGGVMSLCTT